MHSFDLGLKKGDLSLALPSHLLVCLNLALLVFINGGILDHLRLIHQVSNTKGVDDN